MYSTVHVSACTYDMNDIISHLDLLSLLLNVTIIKDCIVNGYYRGVIICIVTTGVVSLTQEAKDGCSSCEFTTAPSKQSQQTPI